METLSATERTERLMQALGFTEEDLTENQDGRLSFRQHDNFKQLAEQKGPPNSSTMAGYGAMVIILVIIVVGVVSSVSKMPPKNALGVDVALAAVFLIIGSVVAFALLRARRKTQLIQSGAAQVKRYSGKARVSLVQFRRVGIEDAGRLGYMLQIGKWAFYPTDPVGKAFVDGQKYTIYALEGEIGSIIVSGEGLD